MAKAALHPKLQAVLNKVTGKSPKDFEKDLEREIILMGIREGKFSREDVLRYIRAGEIRPEVAKELQELWFKPAQPEPKPEQPRPLGPQERLYLPIMRSVWPPDRPPARHAFGRGYRPASRATNTKNGRIHRRSRRSAPPS